MKVEKDSMGYGMIIGALGPNQYQVTPELAMQLKRYDKQLKDFCTMTEASKRRVEMNCYEGIVYNRQSGSCFIMPYISIFRYYGNADDFNDTSYAIGIFPPHDDGKNSWTYCIVANMQYAMEVTPEEAFLYMNDYEKGRKKAYDICMNLDF